MRLCHSSSTVALTLAPVALIPSGAVVEKLCEYMKFRSCYENAGPKEDIPVQDFMDRIPPEVALELSVLNFISVSQHTCSRSPRQVVSADYLEGVSCLIQLKKKRQSLIVAKLEALYCTSRRSECISNVGARP